MKRYNILTRQGERMAYRAECPFTDYVGRVIYEGDNILHPSGQTGVVVFYPERDTPHDQWVVDYNDGEFESRLCLQVGDRGRAIVRAAAAMLN